MFWFLLLAMVVVVAAVTLAVVGGGDEGPLPEAGPDHLVDPLPLSRPVSRADIEGLRLPLAPRGYRMADVDDVLGRVGAELAERDARIAELEAALAGAQATSVSGPPLFTEQPGFAPADASGNPGPDPAGASRVDADPAGASRPDPDPTGWAASDAAAALGPAQDSPSWPAPDAAPGPARDVTPGTDPDEPGTRPSAPGEPRP